MFGKYTLETAVEKSAKFFDDLQNPTRNKAHDKVAQSIDNFIDELVADEESLFASQTRTSVKPTLTLRQEIGSYKLQPIPLIRFNDNPNQYIYLHCMAI